MTLDADTIDALGYGEQWDPFEAMVWLGFKVEVQRRAKREWRKRNLVASLAPLRAADTREAKRERKRRQRERDPEHQRRLNREAQRRRRERLKQAA